MNNLKIALITDHQQCYNWHGAVISSLIESDFADIILNLSINKIPNEKNKLSAFWKLFLKLDNKLFNPKYSATEKIKTNSLLKGIKTITIDNTLNFNTLISLEIDIVINLTNDIPSKEIIESSTYGVWFISHCDLDKINKRPFGIWEMLNGLPETKAVLRYIKADIELPKTIDKTSTCTDSLSYKRNLNDLLWQAHSMLYNNIALLSKNEDLFHKKLKTNLDVFSNLDINVPFKPPSNLEILGYSLNLYTLKLKQLILSKFYFNQWALIFLNNSENKDPYDLSNYTTILPPKDRFWADPFLIKKENKTYLFIEELIYKNKLGHLAVMEIDEDGNYTKPETIMVKDYHLSYPFVFEDKGTYYMIPETSGNENILLYKSTDFPLKWELEKVLMDDVIAVDTTVYNKDGIYWMFTNIKDHNGKSKHNELYLFYSKDLVSNNWTPHPLNPIVTDVKTARPAGAIFERNNKLYRPSQNCSNFYGYGLNIIEITTLNETDYKEKLIKAIEPTWQKNIISTHTFNSVDNMFISDIKIERKK